MKNLHYKGFTIIEVVLVLAIAGLIFLMVFIALPNLQRTQRDTQRRNDMSLIYEALIQYQANNGYKLPAYDTYVVYNEQGGYVMPYGSGTKLKKFLDNYVFVKNPKFGDPNGRKYNLGFRYCSFNGHMNNLKGPEPGEPCTNTKYGATDGRMTLSQLVDGYPSDGFEEQGYMINVFSYARCNGEQIVADEGKASFAVTYTLEGNGSVCLSNK